MVLDVRMLGGRCGATLWNKNIDMTLRSGDRLSSGYTDIKTGTVTYRLMDKQTVRHAVKTDISKQTDRCTDRHIQTDRQAVKTDTSKQTDVQTDNQTS